MLFMLMGMLGMGLTDTAAKWLVSADYPVIQVIAIRGWFISAILLAWIVVAQRAAGLRTKRPWAHVLRLVVAFTGPVFMFRALQDMPLADVTVIVFGSTFMTTALSVPLFKEKVGLHRWGAVILGLIGVVIALRPVLKFLIRRPCLRSWLGCPLRVSTLQLAGSVAQNRRFSLSFI